MRMNLQQYSVTKKVTGMFLFILLLSFVIHVLLIVPRFKDHSESYARNILKEKASGVANSIDSVLKQAARELEKVAVHPDLVSMDPGRVDKTLFLFDGVTANFLSFWVQDYEGFVISRPDKTERVGADRSGRDYFQESRSTGKTVFSNFFISNADNLTTTIATPIVGADGSIKGVLVGSLGIDERNIDLFRVVTGVSIGESGFAYMVDRTGKIIAHPELAQPEESYEGVDYKFLPHIVDLIAGKEGSGVIPFRGENWVIGYSPVTTSGWGVVVQQPKAEMPNYSGSLLTYFLSIFAAMFVVSAVLSIVFVRHLLQPLKLLGQNSGAQLEGLEDEVGGDEIRILSTHIGEMVDQIKKSEIELKRINLDLEEEIAQRKLVEERLSFNLSILDIQLERSPDGILVVDTDNRVIAFNQRFKNLWNIPDETMESGDNARVLEFVLPKLVDPEVFLQRVRYLYQTPLEKGFDILHLRDGRVLERYSEPMVGVDGTQYGRVWYFRDITEQMRSENEIRHSLQEKETMLKEVHHRVKNNLQAVSGILDLQSAYLKDSEARKLFRDSRNRILTMALLHENLYKGQDQTKVDLQEYVLVLTNHLKNSIEGENNSITVKVDIFDLTLNLDTAIPCGLIITELVSNAFKHAFPEKEAGEIRIEISTAGEEGYRLIVSDDGVGMPDDWDPEAHQTLGLQLVSSLAQQLSGNLDIVSEGGTTFTLSFKEYTEYQGVL